DTECATADTELRHDLLRVRQPMRLASHSRVFESSTLGHQQDAGWSLRFFGLLIPKLTDLNISVPYLVAVLLQGNVPLRSGGEAFPCGELALGYPLLAVVAGEVGLHDLLAVEPMFNLRTVDHNPAFVPLPSRF